MNSRGDLAALLDRVALHNSLFPETAYEFVGLAGFGSGQVYPIFKQRYIPENTFATEAEIDAYMRSIGFTSTGREAEYSNGQYTVGDLRPRNVLKDADLVMVPRAKDGKAGVAELAVLENLGDLKTLPLLFPMISDAEKRDAKLLEQLEACRALWQGAKNVALPVIGDSALYATGSYLYDVWRRIEPEIELALVPGISAHQLAASRAGKFIAMAEEVLSIIPCTGDGEKIKKALAAADSAALYKPSALGESLRGTVEACGPWRRMIRVDHAGLADEKIIEGPAALDAAGEYLSVLLLWR